MMDFDGLAAEKCTPAEPGQAPLSATVIESLLSSLEGWALVDRKRIEKRYAFTDFLSALAFVNAIGGIAEAEGHHPDIALGWGRAEISLTTHDVGGLSRSDFILAAKIERYAREIRTV